MSPIGVGIPRGALDLVSSIKGIDDPWLFRDTFTGANDLALTSHTPDEDDAGNGWTAGSSSIFDIASNKAAGHTLAAGLNSCYVAGIGSDVTIRCDLLIGTTVANGFIVRAADEDNNLEIIIDAANDRTRVYKNVAGVRTELNTVTSVSLDTTSTYAIKIVLNGTSIKVYVDDTLTNDITNTTHQTEKGIGFWQWDGSTTGRWDNLQVE